MVAEGSREREREKARGREKEEDGRDKELRFTATRPACTASCSCMDIMAMYYFVACLIYTLGEQIGPSFDRGTTRIRLSVIEHIYTFIHTHTYIYRAADELRVDRSPR